MRLELYWQLLANADWPVGRRYRYRLARLTRRLDRLEAALHNPKAQVSYDISAARGGAKLYSQLTLLLEFVCEGEGEPTQGMRRVAEDLERELARCKFALEVVQKLAVPRLNTLAQKRGLPEVWLPKPQRMIIR